MPVRLHFFRDWDAKKWTRLRHSMLTRLQQKLAKDGNP